MYFVSKRVFRYISPNSELINIIKISMLIPEIIVIVVVIGVITVVV